MTKCLSPLKKKWKNSNYRKVKTTQSLNNIKPLRVKSKPPKTRAQSLQIKLSLKSRTTSLKLLRKNLKSWANTILFLTNLKSPAAKLAKLLRLKLKKSSGKWSLNLWKKLKTLFSKSLMFNLKLLKSPQLFIITLSVMSVAKITLKVFGINAQSVLISTFVKSVKPPQAMITPSLRLNTHAKLLTSWLPSFVMSNKTPLLSTNCLKLFVQDLEDNQMKDLGIMDQEIGLVGVDMDALTGTDKKWMLNKKWMRNVNKRSSLKRRQRLSSKNLFKKRSNKRVKKRIKRTLFWSSKRYSLSGEPSKCWLKKPLRTNMLRMLSIYLAFWMDSPRSVKLNALTFR